ncbi:HotDog domain-containing protein [Naematelia encephala]|uniref:HotDog domain-containing protein n=1 Tax=Naematelia encephala TaxID=71784 RepID=A0A1Y2AEJ7_9TREE|nr:HotDog domain-containing protein [Naematelia encephala]
MAACLKFLQTVWTSTISKGGHDQNVLSSLNIIQARPGYLRAKLLIENRHLNNHKTIHGGAILSMTDTITSLTLSTLGIPAPTGVSVNISTEFVRPGGRQGDLLTAVGEIVKTGRTLAYTRVTFYTPDDKVVAFGSHTKYMGNAVPTTAFSQDGEIELPVEPKAKL